MRPLRIARHTGLHHGPPHHRRGVIDQRVLHAAIRNVHHAMGAKFEQSDLRRTDAAADREPRPQAKPGAFSGPLRHRRQRMRARQRVERSARRARDSGLAEARTAATGRAMGTRVRSSHRPHASNYSLTGPASRAYAESAMSGDVHHFAGGCLCGAIRYQVHGAALAMGYCCCTDCRKASGSGFIPFMMLPAASVRFSGQTRRPQDAIRARHRRGAQFLPHLRRPGVRRRGRQRQLVYDYAGSLDDPSAFRPTMAIFTRDLPAWVLLPPGLKMFETLPA